MPTASPMPLLPLAAALIAWVVSTQMAYSLPPSSTMLNQCAAVAGWGLWLLVLRPSRAAAGAAPLLAALGVLVLALLVSVNHGTLPSSIGLGMLGLLLGAAGLVWAGADAARRPDAAGVGQAFMTGLLVAGVLGALVAFVQVFWPALADGVWIAASGLSGRAVGNLRQPNHLCTLLLWGVCAAVVLHQQGSLRRSLLWLLVALMVAAVELSASRTGAVGLLVLAGWGLLDRRLSGSARAVLIATPLLYALAWGAVALWSQAHNLALGAEARVAAGGLAEGGSPNARLNVFRTAWQLVAEQPLLGVGFGQFNFAWTLTPMARRPTAFFDHAHNLPLQLMAELGLPLALAVLGLLGWALWRAVARASAASGEAGPAARGAAAMVVLVAVHSMVEYPLWYAYFLLPAAFAWGFAMAQPAPRARGGAPGWPHRPGWPGVAAGALMCSAGLFALVDYQRVTTIYAPPPDAPPLGERIVDAQFNSPLFAHQADYAAATNMRSPAAQALAFDRAPHILLDTRLMMAWARFLAETGERDKARWLAARLREFNHPDAAAFFARCPGPGSAAGPLAAASAAGAVPSAAAPAVSTAKAGASTEGATPAGRSSAGAKGAASYGGGTAGAGAAGGAVGGFQCEPPERSYRWRDFAQAVDWDRLSRLANPGQAPAAASAPGRP